MAYRYLFTLASLLMIFSVLLSYSLSTYTTLIYHYSEFHFFIRQLVAVIVGILLMWGLSWLDPDKWFSKIGFALLLGSSFLIIIMNFLPESMSSSAGGAKRWIRLPFFSLAPTEFFKVGFVFFLSWSLSRTFFDKEKSGVREELGILIPYLVVFLVVAFLIGVLQNDLGQVILLAIVLSFLLIFSGGSFKLFRIFLGIAILIGVVAISTSAHRILRMKLWWANLQSSILSILPSKLASSLKIEHLPEPYQIYHAGNAIKHGGIFGQGLGDGLVKLGFLSEVHTDMVLAGLAEELGFVAVAVCVGVILIILHALFKITNRLDNPKHMLFCLGVALLIAFSFIINAFGVSGIIPIKGIAVPFLSYGGSSLLANSVALGLVLSLSKQAR
ncbi:FtsW/RodA/SpoVE family cell cycle protein [Helicobacter ailurogastricus]|uniref:Probable peptidoglycan glycosyltransferase FtsW n=1 Tax=Helicobacter ailurogastricus TaxID=1578720 RepID=A0A0K2X4U2_9HELI|nr:FtsW/RodA/SpoVE family cell cycle protein [Helicobacter ailurogastricus]CRF40986.1 Cell division protein FtsW [Helicobacter ailurogastricus]CRF42912.1 Cell division protein FtsW [Helicobacter ailurogastricus]CRF44827.1 Cell division protein FtsW [Helicobacter ailurogastricus]CRF52036.1 Cell division protein FtsW [Helicobacter ailurogastricus]BDQ29147.1 putative lipid II flippase FtsW [Helicobacter ailurogastricus]